ncbi:hypothetical protein V6R21_17255 [Limibacter armeniacum]|uniref:hypothetical protein n=1 Tax=Limibacter armeniacum TaxID=466084 RepID=UPI002FE6A5EB
MKPIKIIAFLFFILIAVSCQKDDEVNPVLVELPTWLEERIIDDNAQIESDSMSMANFGAWKSYIYEGEFYFQYSNPVSSKAFDIYSLSGVAVDWSQMSFETYSKMKCCESIVWKAPKYIEI